MKRLCSLFLGAILGLPFAVEAGTPTPATQTDLPAKLTGVLNGLPFPEMEYGLFSTKYHRLGYFIKQCYDDHGDDDDRYTDNGKCKDIFFNSIGTMFDIIGEDDFEDYVDDLGYTFFTGSGVNKKFQISGFFNSSTAPTPTIFVSDIQEDFIKDRLDNAYNRMNKISSSWTGNFNLSVDISLAGISLKKIDTFANVYVDRGDVYMVQGLNRALAGMVYFLKAYNLPSNKRLIFDFVDKMKVVLGGDFDLSLISVTLPEMLGSLKTSGTSADLKTAKTDLTSALTCFKNGYTAITKRSATDTKTYLFGTNTHCKVSLKSHNSLYQFFNQGVVSTFISAMNTSVNLDVGKLGIYSTTSHPAWMRSNLTYRIYLAPLFSGKYASKVCPTKQGIWYLPSSVTSASTFAGGLMPDMTADEILKSFENAPFPVLYDYETYDRLRLSMPYKDGMNTTGAKRRVVYTNNSALGLCTVSVNPSLASAKSGTKLDIYLGGSLKGSFAAGDAQEVNYNANGIRELAFEYTPPSPNGLQSAAGVRPVPFVTWHTATEAQGDVPSVPYIWIMQQNLAKSTSTQKEFEQAIKGVCKKGTTYWKEYVLGTDPKDETDQFRCLITINENGFPEIANNSKLPDSEYNKRVFRTWGCNDLVQSRWMDVTDMTPQQRAAYHFFKVTVEMKGAAK